LSYPKTKVVQKYSLFYNYYNIFKAYNSNMKKKALWLKIRNYHFEHIVPPDLWEKITARFGGSNPFTLAFADKIARKHYWKKAFARRAVWEYKKFIYLGMVSDFHVTPSKYIDVVWHEHLLFTKAYKDFCNTVLEQDFNHYPELIPMAEQTGINRAQYESTIAMYIREFGVQPPATMWDITKYDADVLETKGGTPLYKFSPYSSDSTPLCAQFDFTLEESSAFPEFETGGESGGGGASGDWGDSDDGDGSSGDSDGGGCSGGCGGGCGD
jgi:hypothetical protein